MAPGVWLEGMVLAQGSLHNSKIKQRIREALDEPDAVFPVEGHPAMQPNTGFINLVSTSQPPFHVSLLSRSYFRLRGSVSIGIVQPLP
jgi:hypothetical protein